jgi:hypothetical protein
MNAANVTGQFLIDLTDPRFAIPENADVLAFIGRTNPFAHSDVGSLLFELARDAEGVAAYCPAPGSYAYVVLHTLTDRIFAIAFDMRGLAFRLGALDRAVALAEGASPVPEIGDDWVRVDPFDPNRTGTKEWLVRLRNAATGANI